MAVNATATGCLLEDKGPLPPRYSGPPVPVDTVAAELTSALAAEGITLKRDPRPGDCREALVGEHESATVDAALKAGFARARTTDGWKRGPRLEAGGSLTLTRGNWIAATTLIGTRAPSSPTMTVVVTLMCDPGAETTSATSPPTSASTVSP